MDAIQPSPRSGEEELRRENAELRRRLAEAQARNSELKETIDAIRLGEVDAIVVAESDRYRVYTLEGANFPYRALVENIQEGALTLTVEGVILYANAAFAALRGLPLTSILGSSLVDHVADRDRPQFDMLLAASREGACRGQVTVCNGAASIPVHLSLTPIAVNDDTKISVVVTDRRQDYGRLRLLARMLDSVLDAVTAIDPDGTVIYWNEAAEQLYGWTASEMVGQPVDGTVETEESEQARRTFAELSAGGTWSGEYTARHRDGRRFPVQATKAPVYDEDGALIAIIGTSHDISERKQAETALRRSNEELQRFAYVASHDLQEPLRSIISFSQLLERRYGGKLGEDADEFIGFIVEGGNRMQALIQDLLQLSRIETGAKPLAPTDAAEVVADVVRALETQLREAGATVEIDEMPVVMADAAQLVQVFSNLIGNAVKYRQPGVPPVIAISAWNDGTMVEFSVQDNGIGIEPEYFGQIFEMFRRLHTHDRYEGTGIGLAVVKRIIDRHGGRTRIESVPGEGSTFFFTLPAA